MLLQEETKNNIRTVANDACYASAWSQTPIVGDSFENPLRRICYSFSAAADFYSMSRGFHYLRPYSRSLRFRRRPQSIGLLSTQIRCYASTTYNIQSYESPCTISADAQQRWNELRGLKGPLYPRAPNSDHITSCRDFLTRYEKVDRKETVDGTDVVLCGMSEDERGN